MKGNRIFFFGIVMLAAVVVMVSKFFFDSGPESITKKTPITVGRQSFRLEVVERGIVRPARITAVKSGISGNQGKLIWVLPEGSKVEKGLLIARFDTKPLMDDLHRVMQQFADAQAQHTVSVKASELLKESGRAKEEEAMRKLEIARIKADDFKNGSGPLKRKKLEQTVRQETRNCTLKKKEFEDMEPLLKNGHITQREFEKAENELLNARESLQIAQAALDNFDTYEWPKIVREAEVIREAAKIELERVKRTNELEQQQHSSKTEKYRRDMEVKRQEVQKAKDEVAACDVYSPANGILLYSMLPYQGKKRKIQIGDSIWFGQMFLEIPDTTDLVVNLNIREIDVTKLEVGMEAEIYLDAYPDEVFDGTLAALDELAQEDENHASIRRFFAQIHFDEPSPLIHVGMSAGVHIIYRAFDEVLAIPVTAITYNNGRATVLSGSDDNMELKEVTLGAVGIQWAEVLEGVRENERIFIDALQ